MSKILWACDTAFYAIICYTDIKYTRTFCKIQSFTNTCTHIRNCCAYCILLVHHSIPTKIVDTYENNLHIITLYYISGIYAEGYIVFVFVFGCSYVRSFVHSFVHSFVLPSHLWNYFEVSRASNSSGVYLINHSSESIHIWTISTLEGRLSFYDSSLQGLCPGVGLEVKI